MLVIFYDDKKTTFLETNKVTWLDEYVTINSCSKSGKRLYWGPDYEEFKKAVLNGIVDFTVREVPENVKFNNIDVPVENESAETIETVTAEDIPWEVKLKDLWKNINTKQRCILYSYYPNAYRRLLAGEDLRSDISRNILEFLADYKFNKETFPCSGILPTLNYYQLTWLQTHNQFLYNLLSNGDFSKVPEAYTDEELSMVLDDLDARRVVKC